MYKQTFFSFLFFLFLFSLVSADTFGYDGNNPTGYGFDSSTTSTITSSGGNVTGGNCPAGYVVQNITSPSGVPQCVLAGGGSSWVGTATSDLDMNGYSIFDNVNGFLDIRSPINMEGGNIYGANEITAITYHGDGSYLTGILYNYNQTYSGSTYNSTYAMWAYNQTGLGASGGNSSFNQTLTDSLYSSKIWNYNQTLPFSNWLSSFIYNYNQTYTGGTFNTTYAGLINNVSYLSTYNSTYATWAYNMTIGGGGSQTPWTSNINGDGYNLNNASLSNISSLSVGNTSGYNIFSSIVVGVSPAIIFRLGGGTKSRLGYDSVPKRFSMTGAITGHGMSIWDSGSTTFGASAITSTTSGEMYLDGGGNLNVQSSVTSPTYNTPTPNTGITDQYDSANGGYIQFDGGIIYGFVDDGSDKALKKNITNLNTDLSLFSLLKPSSWIYNNLTAKDGQVGTGLIAQDLILIYPQCVKDANGIVSGKKITYKSIDYSCVSAIQTAKIQELESRLIILENKLK